MNFFQHQAQARKQSKRLVVLFLLAVACIVAAITTITVVALELAREGSEPIDSNLFARHPGGMAVAAIVTIAVIAIATMFKIGKLRAGGGVVAREMGGTLISSETTNPAYRRLRNVVEEIAIASGVPVPEIYVLEQESGINAFAAGYTPADAAVCVTRGTLERLSRDELQGVIAHEFSHVLNGDMRLNIRLMGVLFGILVIGIVAREFLRHARGGGRGKEGGAIVMAALGIMVIGFVGLFFGRLIKAGLSRQREYLADASAVQFTRQKDGLAGALKKIGGLAQGSKLEAADGEEVSHMLFGDGVGYSALFATHPPLVDRIKRIDPQFNPREFADIAKRMGAAESASDVAEAEEMGPPAASHPAVPPVAAVVAGLAAGMASGGLPAAGQRVVVKPRHVVSQVANPAQDDYRTAGQLNARIPERLHASAHMQEYAPAVVLALALDTNASLRLKQLDLIAQGMEAPVREGVEALVKDIDALHPMQRLPLAALAFPALRRRPRPWLEKFVQTLDTLIHADGRVQLGEYCLVRMMSIQVIEALDPSKARAIGRRKLPQCVAEAAAVLAIFAQNGHDDADTARRAYVAGAQSALSNGMPPYAPPADLIKALDAALPVLDQLDPTGKELMVEALTRVMSHDERIAVPEAELLRTVCAALHCPLPPMLSQAA